MLIPGFSTFLKYMTYDFKFKNLVPGLIKSGFIFISLCLTCHQASAKDLKPFTSDGCSAFPDGTLEQQELWLDCCTAHDLAYWQGGTYEQRLQADMDLQTCVAGVNEPAIAALMLAGVRVGGTPYLPTEFRWGYGWPYLRGYQKITHEEEAKIDHELKSMTMPTNASPSSILIKKDPSHQNP